MTNNVGWRVLAAVAWAGCSEGGAVQPDATPVDAPTEFVDVTVEANRLPRADLHVYTSRADGTLIAVAITGADGTARLPRGASVTVADDFAALTEPIGDRNALTIEVDRSVDPTTWTIALVGAPAGTYRRLRTPCGDEGQPTSMDTQVTMPACGRTSELAMVAGAAASGYAVAMATVPGSGAVTFDTWQPVVSVPVTAQTPAELSAGSFFSSYPRDDFSLALTGGLASGMPGVIGVVYQNRSVPITRRSYQRRYEAPPSELTVAEADLLPPLAASPVGSATGARGFELVAPAGGYGRCTIVFSTLRLQQWVVRTGPLAAGPQTVVIPVTEAGTLAVPNGYVDLTCTQNLDFADAAAPMRTHSFSTRF